MLPNNDPNAASSEAQDPGQDAGTQESTQPEYVTREALEQSMSQFQEGLQDMLKNQYRGLQSQTDRYQKNVSEQMTSFEQQLRSLQQKGYVKMTEAEINQAVRENKIDQMLANQGTSQDQSGQIEPTRQPQVSTENFVSAIDQAADAIQKQFGVEIMQDDPEVAKFELDKHAKSPNPLEYLRAYESAVKEKAERVKNQSTARTPSLLQGGPGESNPLANVNDLGQLWEMTPLGKRNG